MVVMVRPPGFEPGTRGWKPLVITPSLQALTLAESMASLNGFGRRGNSKVDALTMVHDSKAEVWDFTCNIFLPINGPLWRMGENRPE